MHLVLIETTGNQQYIFATNKLRENVGASELIVRVGTQFVMDAVAAVGGPAWRTQTGASSSDATIAALRQLLRNASSNPPIESGQKPVEVVVATSGKALLLVQDAKVGEDIIAAVTRAAVEHAPGLQVHGVLSKPFDFATDPIHAVIKQTHIRHASAGAALASQITRFPSLPVVAECRSSGLPAKRLARSSEIPEAATAPYPASAEVLAKRAAQPSWLKRVRELQHRSGLDARLVDSLRQLEDAYPDMDWIAVIHADGNGLGGVFLDFDKVIKNSAQNTAAANRYYIDTLRRFSIALDECTEAAFCTAAKTLRTARDRLPIVPLVLGGDDLTVLCDGRQALEFAVQYIRQFQAEAAKHADVRPVMKAVIKRDLTASVGVAIVKPHFPFHRAYDLAEELLRSAKDHKPHAAIDFQVVYDASVIDLDSMRAYWELADGVRLTARPYLIDDPSDPEQPSRHWTWLETCVKHLRQEGADGRRLLPRTQLHALREALFEGRKVADAQLKLIYDRYDTLSKLFPHRTLFESFDGDGSAVTYLIDAMEVDELGSK